MNEITCRGCGLLVDPLRHRCQPAAKKLVQAKATVAPKLKPAKVAEALGAEPVRDEDRKTYLRKYMSEYMKRKRAGLPTKGVIKVEK